MLTYDEVQCCTICCLLGQRGFWCIGVYQRGSYVFQQRYFADVDAVRISRARIGGVGISSYECSVRELVSNIGTLGNRAGAPNVEVCLWTVQYRVANEEN